MSLKINSIAKIFGTMPNGEVIFSYPLTNENGIEVNIINYGATITSIKVPLKNKKIVDVVLGFDNLENYLKSFELEGAPYLGATVGRYAGRINKGKFVLNGKLHQLNINNNSHSLHGGKWNFSRVVWKVKAVSGGKNPSITLTHTSPNADENYPGELKVELTYTLTEENKLTILYTAKSTEDTIINLTNHSYFNLNGHNTEVLNQELTVNANEILETTPENIPTGVILELANSPFDFSTPKKCPAKIDTSFILNKDKTIAASLYSQKNNLKMMVQTDQPSVHIYVGGDCKTIEGKEKSIYHAASGICFETQNFPDAPNHGHFPNAVLKKGETYSQKTSYQFEIN